MIEKISNVISKYEMKISGVVHIGAHYGQEVNEYLEKTNKVVCFEPLLSNFEQLKRSFAHVPGVTLFRCALGDKEGTVEMHVPSNFTMSSSILKPKLHLIDHPGAVFNSIESVEIKKLSSFKEDIKDCNFLNVDVQGYEYEVLVGAENLLNQFEYIYCEVNRDETYEKNHEVEDLDEYLKDFSFKRIETWWAARTWGDALYTKN